MLKIINKYTYKILIFSLLVFGLLFNPYNIENINADSLDNYELKEVQNSQIEIGQTENIRIDLKKITALKDIIGEIKIIVGEKNNNITASSTIPVNVKKGDQIIGMALFPVAEGKYSIELKSFQSIKPVLSVNGNISRNGDSYLHSLSDIDRESNWILTDSSLSAIDINIGYVDGNIIVQSFLSNDINPDECILSTNLDKNMNDKFELNEKQNFQIQDNFSTIKSELVTRLPLKAKYEINIICENNIVASNKGIYDLVEGDALEAVKFRDPKSVKLFGVGLERTPYVTQVSIPGYMISPPADILKVLPEEKEKFIDILQEKSLQDLLSEKENLNSEISNSINEDSSDTVNDIVNGIAQDSSLYFPIILAIFFVVFFGGFSAMFFTRKLNK